MSSFQRADSGVMTARRSSQRGSFFRADVQGMRAIAVLAVVLYHAGVPFIPGGYVGVDIFFVISGFLITGLLLREMEHKGRISFADFYARRIRRLLPASALVLIVTLAGAKLLLPPLLMPDIAKDGVATSLFLANMWLGYTGTDYLAGTSPSPFQHYWSLALEEQFYLVWPLVMVLAAGVAGYKARKRIAVVLAVLTVGSFIAGVVLTGIHQPWAFFSLPTRAWELGAGALLALGGPLLRRMTPGTATALGWIGLALLAASILTFNESFVFPGWVAVVPVLGAVLLLAGGQTQGLSFLSARPLQYFGNISYSLYLWHWPLLTLAQLRLGDSFNGWIAGGLVLLSVLLAHLSHGFVEVKFQKAPGLKDRRWKTYSFGAGLTIIAVVLSWSAVKLPELDAGKSVPQPTDVELVSAPRSPGFVPSNLTPTLESAENSLPIVYNDGCHAGFGDTASAECTYGDNDGNFRIVLFGDSHAAQWFTPLHRISDTEDGTLVSLTKSSCPSVEVSVRNKLSDTYPECDEWRQNSIDRINDLAPDIVVLSNYSSSYRKTIRGTGDWEQDWGEGLARTVQALPEETRIVVLGDTPSWKDAPNVCLSSNLHDVNACAVPIGEVVDSAAHEVEESVIRSLNREFVSPTEWVCEERCSPVIWNRLVYRDSHHLTNEMAASLTGQLGKVIDQ